MKAVRLRPPFDDLTVVRAWNATDGERDEALARERAAFEVRALPASALDVRTLTNLRSLAFEQALSSRGDETAGALRQDVEEAIGRGLLLVVKRPRRAVVVPLEGDDAGDGPLGPMAEKQDVEFDFEYADGTPVSGLKYVLTDSGGTKTKGALGNHGVVQRKDVAGTWTVALTEVERVVWGSAGADAGQEVTIAARTSGVDDGAAMAVRIYRLWDEDPSHALATLSLTVQQSVAQGTWKYQPAPDEQGVASFVAEASLEGGAIWRKSAPLAVALPAVAQVAWSQPRAAPGDAVDLVVQTQGFPDGTEVAITLFRHDVAQGDTKVADLTPPPLQGRSTRTTLQCGGATFPANTGDVYAKVTVKKDGVERTGCSPLLWVDLASAQVA